MEQTLTNGSPVLENVTTESISNIPCPSPFTEHVVDLFFYVKFIKKRNSFVVQLYSITEIRGNLLKVIANLESMEITDLSIS